MSKNFDSIQKEFYNCAEVKRFYWQTQNPYVCKKEMQLLSFFKNIVEQDDLILEIGCGEGANVVCLRAMGIHNNFTGVDFSEEKVQFCRALNINNATFQQADARGLPFEDGTFSVTLARDLLHHVNEDRKQVIDELLRVTKPGGKVVIVEGNVQKFTNHVFSRVYKHEQGMKDSNRKQFEKLLKGLNYSISTAEASNFFRLLLHYNIGMPYLGRIKFFQIILDIQQSLFEIIIPPDNRAYWVIQIQK